MSTTQTWTGPDPAHITAWTIVQAGHYAGQIFYKELAEVGLTPTQFGTLLQLDLQPDMSNNRLARAIHVSPQSMSELLTSLVELELIARTTPLKRGHRVEVRLTSKGVATLKTCEAVIARIEASLGLNNKQLASLNVLLRTIIDTD